LFTLNRWEISGCEVLVLIVIIFLQIRSFQSSLKPPEKDENLISRFFALARLVEINAMIKKTGLPRQPAILLGF
jgi:hypothetical protein